MTMALAVIRYPTGRNHWLESLTGGMIVGLLAVIITRLSSWYTSLELSKSSAGRSRDA